MWVTSLVVLPFAGGGTVAVASSPRGCGVGAGSALRSLLLFLGSDVCANVGDT